MHSLFINKNTNLISHLSVTLDGCKRFLKLTACNKVTPLEMFNTENI